ncbi:MAG: beta-ketoacyl synthase N-terminal-like domain-containing protein, partial [Alphaproteobacteria bacterium]
SNEKTGLIVGSGGPSVENLEKTIDIAREKGPKRVGPFMVPKTMSSTCSATLATSFKIKGYNYSITSACSTSAHCIGNAYELISWGKQDVIFAGGGEELHWGMAVQFDAMGALSTKYNDTPEKASRAYDKDRDGFVIGEGAGIVVLEEYEHAKARGAKIYAEIVGYGANSDGFDMVAPSGEGAERCMKLALENVKDDVDYINAHGTSTPVGDVKELGAMVKTFPADKMPVIGSTKSYTGHSLGATGAQEVIYSLIMMENNFIAESINIENLDEEAKDLPIATQKIKKDINVVMSNSFGFGGTNASLVFKKI